MTRGGVARGISEFRVGEAIFMGVAGGDVVVVGRGEFVGSGGGVVGGFVGSGGVVGGFVGRGGAVDVACSGLGDGGAAGVGEAEDFGDFVEAFADGVVAGGADDFEIVMFFHIDDLGVATRDDEGEEGKGGCGWGGDEGRYRCGWGGGEGRCRCGWGEGY